MITSVRLQNWTSFGELQTAPLEAITVLVGANNSGKSNFLQALRTLVQWPGSVHRPAVPPITIARGITVMTDQGECKWDLQGDYDAAAGIAQSVETVFADRIPLLQTVWRLSNGVSWSLRGNTQGPPPMPIMLPHLAGGGGNVATSDRLVFKSIFDAMQQARIVHLRAGDIRLPNLVRPDGTIEPEGGRLAALIARWALEAPERRDEFNDILRRCLPEMKGIHAPPAPSQHGTVRLVFEQKDGERFDAATVSDGVVLFSALIAHAVEAPRGGLILIEEPERGLHPRRLAELLDVLRTLVASRQVQFVLATHSQTLLALMRDEPESILLFRRTATGTQIRRLSDVPQLAENLSHADPGELLVSGAFDEGFKPERAAS